MAGKEMEIQKKAKTPKKEKKKSRFFKEFWGEVKKLTWSTPKELVVNTLTVIAFVALFAIIIGVLDAVLGVGLKAILNLG
ncbi:MAG: preprotein translocase subunit SecE [Clostridia bacterium]|nr:preprotein translocase subunit SecE [Clostridia bacterium]